MGEQAQACQAKEMGEASQRQLYLGLKCESPQLIQQGYRVVAKDMPSSLGQKGVSHGKSKVRTAILAVPRRQNSPGQAILLGPQI